MSTVDRAARLFAGPRDRHDGYVLCAEDGFWFRPTYTAGKCPLCGEHPTIKDLSIHRGSAAACAADDHAEGNGQPATAGVPAAKAGG